MSDRTYLSRYISGERQQVWDELIALGVRVRDASIYPDALAVARETMVRARENIQRLHLRLVDLGFEFADPGNAYVPAKSDAAQRVKNIERALGTLPISAYAWFETFESVQFVQSARQLKDQNSDVGGLGCNPSLIVESLEKCMEQSKQYQKQNVEQQVFLPAGCIATNNDCKGFYLPNACADGVFYNEGAGDRYFVDELRWCLKWGGMPFSRLWMANGSLEKKRSLPFAARPNVENIFPALVVDMLDI